MNAIFIESGYSVNPVQLKLPAITPKQSRAIAGSAVRHQAGNATISLIEDCKQLKHHVS